MLQKDGFSPCWVFPKGGHAPCAPLPVSTPMFNLSVFMNVDIIL